MTGLSSEDDIHSLKLYEVEVRVQYKLGDSIPFNDVGGGRITT